MAVRRAEPISKRKHESRHLYVRPAPEEKKPEEQASPQDTAEFGSGRKSKNARSGHQPWPVSPLKDSNNKVAGSVRRLKEIGPEQINAHCSTAPGDASLPEKNKERLRNLALNYTLRRRGNTSDIKA